MWKFYLHRKNSTMKYISKNELKNNNANFEFAELDLVDYYIYKKIRTCSTDDDAQVLYSFSGT